MTSKILAPSLLALMVAGCTSSSTQTASTAPAATKIATSTAQRVHGDVVPSKLVPLDIPRPTETALLAGSDALAPGKPYAFDEPAPPVVGYEFRRVMKGTDPAAFTFPVDAPQGARVIVRAIDPTQSLTTLHLRNATTGALLDMARDPGNSLYVQHGAGAPSPDLATLRASKDGANDAQPGGRPLDALGREPGFAPMLSSRMVAFDLPTTPGLVRLEVSPAVAASGVIMELQQPATRITLSGVPNELNFSYGDHAQLSFSLASDSEPIDGATLTGYAELKDHTATPSFDVVAKGGGVYTADLPLTAADWQHMGVWGIHVKATGSFHGVAFERDVETAFGYYVPHAQMTAVGAPRTVRGADGLVDEVTVDVDVQSLADDRFSVRGTLTTAGSDGAEHAIASAQTGQTMNAGTATMTLHFSAASMALARIDGPFHVRDLALVSQAFGFTEHRLGMGLGLTTDAFKAAEIRFPKVISIQAQDLIANGDLPAP
jgi:hypothetical protein